MAIIFFRNPQFPYSRTHMANRASSGGASGDTRIALPSMDARGWVGYVARRLPILAVGAALVFHLAVAVFFLGAGVVCSWVNPPLTSLMVERYLKRGFAPRPVSFVPFAQLPQGVPDMYLKLEDKNFYRHRGIDPAAIVYAYRQNKRWGRTVMGGSTIDQQLARTLFLSPDKNYLRKYVEAIAAVALDAVVDKKRILELYLNYIEWGKGVYGLGTAAQFYFKKPASKLTYDEYARLAAIIVDPVDFNVNNFYDHPAMAARYYVLTAPPPAADDTSIAPAESEPAPSGGADGAVGEALDAEHGPEAVVPSPEESPVPVN